MAVNKLERARQFLPFDALKGFKEALLEKEKVLVDKVELSEEKCLEISNKINNINNNDILKIKYYYHKQYIDVIGKFSSIDKIRKKIIINNDFYINIDDIIYIEVI